MLKEFYSKDTEIKMKELFDNLSEKNRRLYAGVEAAKLPHGRVNYLAKVLNCSPKTIDQGLKDNALRGPPLAHAP